MRVSVGMDVDKVLHCACGKDQGGRICLDGVGENTSAGIGAFMDDLLALVGEAAIGLDVVGSLALFLEAFLLAEGFARAHALGIAVNRAGQGFARRARKSAPCDTRTNVDLVPIRDLHPILTDA